MIRFDRVSKRYGHREVLAGLSFEVGDAEMVSISGRSGCGKSTVLRLIVLLERATQGQIWVNGAHLATLRPRDLPRFRSRIGLLAQRPRLLADRSVRDNVALPLIAADVGARARSQRVQAVLERVGLLPLARSRAGELSAAERTRVALARALIAKPPLLLADEPDASLDAALGAALIELLREVNGEGVTVVLAPHDPRLGQALGLREIVLDRNDPTELAALPVMTAVR